jgi:hypothetical protein
MKALRYLFFGVVFILDSVLLPITIPLKWLALKAICKEARFSDFYKALKIGLKYRIPLCLALAENNSEKIQDLGADLIIEIFKIKPVTPLEAPLQ